MTDQEIYTAVRDAMSNCKPVERVSYKLKEAAQATGLSESFLRSEIAKKKLVAVRLDKHLLIETSQLRKYLTDRRTVKEEMWESLREDESTITSSGSMAA